MSHGGWRADAELGELAADVHVHAAAFYVSCLKNGFHEEATEFAEWYLDTFDHDLES